MKRRLFILLFLLLPSISFAQSDFDFTQRWLKQAIYNPAAAGSNFYTRVSLHARQQWLGTDGAPTTGAVAFDAFIPEINSGIGVTMMADKIGFTKTYNPRIMYAYHIPLTAQSILSFGVSGGVLIRHLDASGAIVNDLNDPQLYYGNVIEYTPDFDFGFEYQGKIRLGGAVRHVGMQPSRNNLPHNSLNIWLYASARFNRINRVSIEPIGAYIHREGVNSYEVGAIMYLLRSRHIRRFNDWAWIGGTFRHRHQFMVMAGIYLTEQLSVGYSFDYGIADLSKITKFGTHEISVSYKFTSLFQKFIPCAAFGKSEKMNHFW